MSIRGKRKKPKNKKKKVKKPCYHSIIPHPISRQCFGILFPPVILNASFLQGFCCFHLTFKPCLCLEKTHFKHHSNTAGCLSTSVYKSGQFHSPFCVQKQSLTLPNSALPSHPAGCPARSEGTRDPFPWSRPPPSAPDPSLPLYASFLAC